MLTYVLHKLNIHTHIPRSYKYRNVVDFSAGRMPPFELLNKLTEVFSLPHVFKCVSELLFAFYFEIKFIVVTCRLHQLLNCKYINIVLNK